MLGSPGEILRDSFQWAQSGVPSPHPGSFCHPKILPADAQAPKLVPCVIGSLEGTGSTDEGIRLKTVVGEEEGAAGREPWLVTGSSERKMKTRPQVCKERVAV